MKYDVFISYSRKDTEIADKICAALDKQGISYFIDRKGIGGGMEFPAVLADAIINSELMLFIGSENSYKSKFTNNEVTFAFNKKASGTIIPYIIDGSSLPLSMELTFSSINIRTLKEHPIESVLMDDICKLLGRDNSPQKQNEYITPKWRDPNYAPNPKLAFLGDKELSKSNHLRFENLSRIREEYLKTHSEEEWLEHLREGI